MRRWLARRSQESAFNAQKDDWDRCLTPDNSAAQNYLQPGSNNSAGILEVDEAADWLLLDEISGCMASSDSCSIPMSSLLPARSLELITAEHSCCPMVIDEAPVRALDADAQKARVDYERHALLEFQRLSLLLEVHDDWLKQLTCDKQCEADTARSAQHPSEDMASKESLQETCHAFRRLPRQTVTTGSSFDPGEVCKANCANVTAACGS